MELHKQQKIFAYAPYDNHKHLIKKALVNNNIGTCSREIVHWNACLFRCAYTNKSERPNLRMN